MVYYPQRYRVS